ncbi:hypothetical protein FV226_11125 [Methylobacterium sp. WL12]|uniref:hypothetical protein n=1 Tax=Methylobacterium sp. WL12 TaxID=2603890 RepID=UPI0011C7DF73|nr:hypothetical protein [Methylobacterium sp. WL12]TXM72892.1 hypothetical protein FV226_11125 [Methylobacterium sp. WL12]
MDFKTYDEMSKLLTLNGNIITCPMASLRDAHGAGKLGVTVTNNISAALAHRGVGHNPATLPQQQWESVRLYKLGTTVADLITAATEIGDANDEKVRQLANSTAIEDLKKVREIVCG